MAKRPHKTKAKVKRKQPAKLSPYVVFISHAHKDTDLARDLINRLREIGIQTNTLNASVSGTAIENSIINTLSDVDEVIVILTDDSVDSRWLMYEMGVASSLRKRITPVIVGINANKLPSLIKNMQFVKYADLSKYISDLEKRAKEAA